MKKLLKLLFVLSATTVLPLSVVACGQESLDSTLNVINSGKNQYSITDLFKEKVITDYQEKYTLSITETNTLAKNIAQTILNVTNNKTKIIWADENPQLNQKVYNYKITNGTKDPDNKNLTWDAKKVTGSFEIKISYLVGTINEQKNFIAKQQINMTFKIKTYISESDKIVEKWVDEFNEVIDKENWITNPLIINLKEGEISLPNSNISYSDLDGKIKSATISAIESNIKDKTVSWLITNKNKIDNDKKLKISLSANKNDAIKITKEFYIQFKQIKK